MSYRPLPKCPPVLPPNERAVVEPPPPNERLGAELPPPKERADAEPPPPNERVLGAGLPPPNERVGAEPLPPNERVLGAELPPPNERVRVLGVKVRLGSVVVLPPNERVLGRVTVVRVLLWRALPKTRAWASLLLPPPKTRVVVGVPPNERVRLTSVRLPLPKVRLAVERWLSVSKRLPRPKSPRLNPSRIPDHERPLLR